MLHRSSAMVRWYLPNVGTIDEAAQAAIDAMPQFSYRKDKAGAADAQRLKDEKRAARLAVTETDRAAKKARGRAAQRDAARAIRLAAAATRAAAAEQAAAARARTIAARAAAKEAAELAARRAGRLERRRTRNAREPGERRAAVVQAFLKWRAEQPEQVR